MHIIDHTLLLMRCATELHHSNSCTAGSAFLVYFCRGPLQVVDDASAAVLQLLLLMPCSCQT